MLTGGGLLLAFAPGKAASEAGIGLMFIGAGLAFLVGWLKIVRRMESEATRDAVGAILLLVGHQVVLVLAGVGLVLIAYGILSLARAAGAT